MIADITVDAKDFLSLMDRFSKVAPRAQEIAINRTVEEVLAEARKLVQRNFTVRNPRFILPPIQLPKVWRADAKRNRLFAVAALGDFDGRGSIGARRSLLLSKFEPGGQLNAGRLPIAIPTDTLRGAKSAVIPRKLYPRNLIGEFNQDGILTGLGRKARLKGRKRKKAVGRFFVLGNQSDRFWGIYTRTGPGESDIRRLWTFRNRIPIPQRLPFTQTTQKIVDQRFEANLRGAIELLVVKT